jgi:hypothetical protein
MAWSGVSPAFPASAFDTLQRRRKGAVIALQAPFFLRPEFAETERAQLKGPTQNCALPRPAFWDRTPSGWDRTSTKRHSGGASSGAKGAFQIAVAFQQQLADR